MTTYHKINSASKDELKQISIKTAELNQKMYAMLASLDVYNGSTASVKLQDEIDKLLAEARGEL